MPLSSKRCQVGSETNRPCPRLAVAEVWRPLPSKLHCLTVLTQAKQHKRDEVAYAKDSPWRYNDITSEPVW